MSYCGDEVVEIIKNVMTTSYLWLWVVS